MLSRAGRQAGRRVFRPLIGRSGDGNAAVTSLTHECTNMRLAIPLGQQTRQKRSRPTDHGSPVALGALDLMIERSYEVSADDTEAEVASMYADVVAEWEAKQPVCDPSIPGPYPATPISYGSALHLSRPIFPAQDSTATMYPLHYYDHEDMKQVFPEGLGDAVMREWHSTRRYQFMMREQTLEILRAMENEEQLWIEAQGESGDERPERDAFRRFLAWGPSKCGKSIAMHQLVYFARKRGWLTIFIPSAYNWTLHSTGAQAVKEIGLYDVEDMSVDMLKQLQQAHSDILSKLPMRQAYDHKYYTSRAEDDPPSLLDMIKAGIRLPEMAPEVLRNFRAELNDMPQDIPILIAIDDYNAFFEPTAYTRRGGGDLNTKRLAIVDVFGSLHRGNLSEDRMRGIMVGATSEKLREAKNLLPTNLRLTKASRKQKMREEQLTEHTSVNYGPLDDKEFRAVLSHYYHHRFMPIEAEESDVILLKDMSRSCHGHLQNVIFGCEWLF